VYIYPKNFRCNILGQNNSIGAFHVSAEKMALEFFQKAILAENRHDLNLAKKYYLQFYHSSSTSNQKIPTGFDCNRVASFFYDNGEYEKAIYFAKHPILADSKECLAVYLYCCEHLIDPIEYLEWAQPYITLNPFFEHSCRFFRLLNQYVDAYQVVYEVFEKIEEQFFGSTVTVFQYVD
jgi:tetratricopeptide (TPR) repeat protein